jgi:hypothetical protein
MLTPRDLKISILGHGRVGKALQSIAGDVAFQLPSLRTAALLPPLPPGPIAICSTNDSLDRAIDLVPSDRHNDLVFFQNGMLVDLLQQRGLQHATQVLLYVSAAEDGHFVDGLQTSVHGMWAETLSAVFAAGGVRCRAVGDRGEFDALMIQKLLWGCTFWLLSAALGSVTVGEIATKHEKEVEALVAELLPVAQRYIRTKTNAEPRPVAALQAGEIAAALNAYSLSIPRSVPSVAMAIAEFRWRNGWFLAQEVSPLHVEWLRQAGVNPEQLMGVRLEERWDVVL